MRTVRTALLLTVAIAALLASAPPAEAAELCLASRTEPLATPGQVGGAEAIAGVSPLESAIFLTSCIDQCTANWHACRAWCLSHGGGISCVEGCACTYGDACYCECDPTIPGVCDPDPNCA